MQNNMNKGKKIMIITLIIFILPVVISTTLFMTGWRPGNTVNYGTLISPAKLLSERTLQDQEGKPVQLQQLRGKWTMVYFDSAACGEPCMQQLYFMRQTHLSLGKDFDRIQRVFILKDTQSIDSLKGKLAEYPGMFVLSGGKEAIAAMLREFGADDGQRKDEIYLVDPQGFLMMRYLPNSDPKGVRKDFERLLKYSGDNR